MPSAEEITAIFTIVVGCLLFVSVLGLAKRENSQFHPWMLTPAILLIVTGSLWLVCERKRKSSFYRETAPAAPAPWWVWLIVGILSLIVMSVIVMYVRPRAKTEYPIPEWYGSEAEAGLSPLPPTAAENEAYREAARRAAAAAAEGQRTRSTLFGLFSRSKGVDEKLKQLQEKLTALEEQRRT